MSPSGTAAVPQHVAIVMDGNGRWAQARGLPRTEGHRRGAENIRRIILECIRLGIKYLTIYAFSTENWTRPQAEVDYLMSLPILFFQRERQTLHKHNVRVRAIGKLDGVPTRTREVVERVQSETASYERLNLIVAFNYGARDELVRAVNRLAERIRQGEVVQISEADLANELDTAGIPDPDLIIRCGNEVRLSNFLLWQAAYAELYFSDTLWPDFSEADLQAAVADFGRRTRRFGGVINLKR
ncbi:MAG: isoprenyl transferase [Bacillota bacterium]